jgi:hypothetical protein
LTKNFIKAMNKQNFFSVFMLCLILLGVNQAHAQIKFQVISLVEGVYSIDRVFQFSIMNTNSAQTLDGYVQIKVRDFSNNIIAEHRSVRFKIKPFESMVGNGIDWQTNITGSSKESLVFKEQGLLPYGKHTCCYSFVSSGVKADEYCSEIFSKPQLPPQLMNPSNMSVITTINPLLTWIPPIPDLSMIYQYNLKMVELKNGQTCAQALQQNIALIQERNYEETNYQTSDYRGIELENGKSYCWQVEAYSKKNIIGSTEIWNFKIDDSKQQSKSIDDNSPYFYLKHTLDGHTVNVEGLLKVVFDNRYGSTKLNYIIKNENGEVDGKIVTPEIALYSNINQISFDCRNIKGLKPNEPYVLEVMDEDNTVYYCKFIYGKK